MKTMNKTELNKIAKYIPFQLCPKCNGDGNLMRYNSPPMTTTNCPVCDVCNGKKIIPMYLIQTFKTKL